MIHLYLASSVFHKAAAVQILKISIQMTKQQILQTVKHFLYMFIFRSVSSRNLILSSFIFPQTQNYTYILLLNYFMEFCVFGFFVGCQICVD